MIVKKVKKPFIPLFVKEPIDLLDDNEHVYTIQENSNQITYINNTTSITKTITNSDFLNKKRKKNHPLNMFKPFLIFLKTSFQAVQIFIKI